MTQQSAQLPSPAQVIELLADDFAAAGYQIEDVAVVSSAKPPRISIVADGDDPLDLDAVAELSRLASHHLDDALPDATPPYLLEVSSPGVDRPLTAARHYRRAQGRKVAVSLVDGTSLEGRLGALSGDAVDLVVRAGRELTVRPLDLADIATAVVQVEFAKPNPRELELAGMGAAEEVSE
ncbi:hypothetical protein MBRU_09185 [Mycolicibacterium brumae DSM 44177]|nr:hypothetical protein MBRU_09185 [Mycolicibacterium brumae DSM 44177]